MINLRRKCSAELSIVCCAVQSVFHYYSCSLWCCAVGVPSDGVPDAAIVTVAAPVTAIFSILAVCGIGFAVVCLIFNFVSRNKK